VYCALRLLSHSLHWHRTMHRLYIASGVQGWVVCRMEELAQRIKSLEKGVSRGLSVLENRSQPADSLPAEQSDAVWVEGDDDGRVRLEDDSQQDVLIAIKLDTYKKKLMHSCKAGPDGEPIGNWIRMPNERQFIDCFKEIGGSGLKHAAIKAFLEQDIDTQIGPFSVYAFAKMKMHIYCGLLELDTAARIELGVNSSDDQIREDLDDWKRKQKPPKKEDGKKNPQTKSERNKNRRQRRKQRQKELRVDVDKLKGDVEKLKVAVRVDVDKLKGDVEKLKVAVQKLEGKN
jgi:hypothetical protein